MKKRFLCEKRGAEGGGYIFREENHLYTLIPQHFDLTLFISS